MNKEKKEEHEAAEVIAEMAIADAVEEQGEEDVVFEKATIEGIECEGFSLVAKTSVGCYLLGDDEHGIQQLPNKEVFIDEFQDAAALIKNDESGQARKDWDELHLICIHTPSKIDVIKGFASGIIKWQSIYLPSASLQFTGVGCPISEDILKLKAFDLHDDIIAQVNLEREEKA